MKPNNPFLISGYYSPEYFCNRERETQTITDALYNGRNLTLIAPRRMGKTGLIKRRRTSEISYGSSPIPYWDSWILRHRRH